MGTSSETELIALIKRLAGQSASAAVATGIGDDAAVLQPPDAGHQLVATTDQVVENKHFVLGQHPPEALGHKLLARGLSDIAAMGATPSWFLLSLAIPATYDNDWLECFVRGLLNAREKFCVADLPLAGGDISSAECFMGHIAAVGAVPSGEALLRSTAMPGDRLYVSGELGGSALGFEQLSSGLEVGDAVTRHLWPVPRLALGRFLRESGATAALDISDGLSTDLHRVATASGVAARIDAAALPRFPGASDDQVLHGGEEYELLFTAPESVAVPREFDGVRLTRIGTVAKGAGVEIVRDDRVEPLPPGGFEHLR